MVSTDHHSLRWLLTDSDPSGRLTRWRLWLVEFYFTIYCKKGPDNNQSDALTRILTGTSTNANGDDHDIPEFLLHIEDNDNYSNIGKTSTPPEMFM